MDFQALKLAKYLKIKKSKLSDHYSFVNSGHKEINRASIYSCSSSFMMGMIHQSVLLPPGYLTELHLSPEHSAPFTLVSVDRIPCSFTF